MSQTISEADLYAMPSPVVTTGTKEFETVLGMRSVTIWTDGKVNSARFFKITEALSRAAGEVGPDAVVQKPLKIAVPPTKPGDKQREIVVDSPGYLGQLYTLAAVANDPPWNARQWALFGDRLGPRVIEEINDWAMTENGLSEYFFEKIAAIKKALEAAGDVSNLTNGSPVPVSNISTNSLKRPSETRRKKA